MGSRPTQTQYAYIAGFLDGDGSIMMQLKKRTDSGRARFMLTICFYQDTRHEKPLLWMRDVFGIGYISRRNDGMTELRINGYKTVHDILAKLKPFIRFKSVQVDAVMCASVLLQKKPLMQQEYEELVDLMLRVQGENYRTRSKKTKDELLSMLGLAP